MIDKKFAVIVNNCKVWPQIKPRCVGAIDGRNKIPEGVGHIIGLDSLPIPTTEVGHMIPEENDSSDVVVPEGMEERLGTDRVEVLGGDDDGVVLSLLLDI